MSLFAAIFPASLLLLGLEKSKTAIDFLIRLLM